jgi:hypothetical protein
MTLLEDAVRLGLSSLIIVGRDPDGDLTLIYEAELEPERVYLMVNKALRIIEDQPLDMEIEDDDTDDEGDD